VKKLLLLATATVLMAACSDAPTSPRRPTLVIPSGRASADLVCASGYIIAYDENGNPYCAPDPNAQAQAQAQARTFRP
jgi:hypothetical protein